MAFSVAMVLIGITDVMLRFFALTITEWAVIDTADCISGQIKDSFLDSHPAKIEFVPIFSACLNLYSDFLYSLLQSDDRFV